MEAYRVNIVGLSNKVHHFDYELGDDFFEHYGSDLISKGSFIVKVMINKHETFLEVNFEIAGTAKLICDRSLEEFDYPIKTKKMVVFKYGDEDQEISEEIIMIQRDTVSLELGQFIYEFIGLAVPMKKLHPRFDGEDDNNDDDDAGRIIYSSDSGTGNDTQDEIDPRWEKLKKLK
ncbi:MAG TPA: DUF177 domain-containing protein [Cyclobacteriaceae bacterium]|nr:DUF177 domain-containing protein [Cyclobacteriaceae bacterium]